MIRNITHLYRLQPRFSHLNRFVQSAQQKPIHNHYDFRILQESDMAPFLDYVPKVRRDACSDPTIMNHPLVKRRFERMLDYVLPCGNLSRQHVLIYTYKKIEEHHGTFSEEKLEEAYKLAWLVEMICAQFSVVDDLVDNHEMRCGKLAWHKQKDIGMSAIWDGYLLQYGMFNLVKKYFSQHPNYTKILENFMRLEMSAGCVFEIELNKLEDFTLERSEEIGDIKSSYYLFGQPFELATLLANKELNMRSMVDKAFKSLSWLYNLQNDMLDCYAEELDGKPGVDIQNKVCTGLIALALLKASPKQRKILDENYGSWDEEKIRRVKQVYDELNIRDVYFEFEKVLHKSILNDIQNIPDSFARNLVENFAYAATFGEIGIPPTF